MEPSRSSSRSSTRSPKQLFSLLLETPRDFSATGQLGRQEPSLFSLAPCRQQSQLTPHVQLQRSSPFKQAVRGSTLQVHDIRSSQRDTKPHLHPGQTLMTRTEQSLERVRQQIISAPDPTEEKPGWPRGRLVKGHLKPLRTVRVSGPPIDACCGIVPQKAINTFGATASVKRRGLIIANLDTTRQMYDTLVSQYEALAVNPLS